MAKRHGNTLDYDDDCICIKAKIIILKFMTNCFSFWHRLLKFMWEETLDFIIFSINVLKDDADCSEIKEHHCTTSSCCPFNNFFEAFDDRQLCDDSGDGVACCKSPENCNWEEDAARGEIVVACRLILTLLSLVNDTIQLLLFLESEYGYLKWR